MHKISTKPEKTVKPIIDRFTYRNTLKILKPFF